MKNYILTGKKGQPVLDLHRIVFPSAASLAVLFVLLSLIFLDTMGYFFEAARTGTADNAGWFFTLTVNAALVYTLVLLFTRYGRIRLGGADARPEFSTFGWFAMLFAAGMGIGLLFYSVAEPIHHLIIPPQAKPETAAAAAAAMGFTYLHWGLHPWAIYAFIALCLAFFGFNRGLPLSIRSAFYPLMGDRVYGGVGHLIDVVAILATLFGVATSLGLGVKQINAGLNHLLGIQQTAPVQIVLIAVITAVATTSVVLGVDKGIRRLSVTNLVVAGILALFVLILGPTLFMLNGIIENIGYYLQHFFELATWNEAYTRSDWQNSWTIFYWSWWIAWSPFVGMFIARVSWGRTIREFITGVLLVPTLVTFVWLTIFGNSALWVELFGIGGIGAAVQENIAISLFVFLQHFPLELITGLLATIVVAIFFVTSADSASLVIDTMAAGGKTTAPTVQRIFWAVLQGAIAATLLLGGGRESLEALQTAVITTGLPFAILLVLAAWSLIKGLQVHTAEQGLDVQLGEDHHHAPALQQGSTARWSEEEPFPSSQRLRVHHAGPSAQEGLQGATGREDRG